MDVWDYSRWRTATGNAEPDDDALPEFSDEPTGERPTPEQIDALAAAVKAG